ncbi:MAG: hypothetical protein IPN59_07055 [Holophaga sp.]|nr:hypothetical protein [Holophaga sp.]
MRPLLLLFLCAMSLPAQVPEAKWSFDLHTLPATLEGNFQGTVDGQAISLDLKKDLALEKDQTRPGGALEYQGHRFGFTLAMDAQDYKGSAVITQQVIFNGTTYEVGTLVTSSVRMKSYDLNWTIRALTWEQAWVGIDLGFHGWDLDMTASGDVNGTPTTAAKKIAIPIPQLGLSIGGKAFGDRFVSRASFHILKYKGATYHRWQGDARYFPLSWLGVRAFLDDESFDVPKDSVKDDLIFNLKRAGAGLGVVVRF